VPERGFSLLEVMIAVAILAVALTALLGNLGTLDSAHVANRETAKAQEIAQVLAERIQGARWTRLGTADEPWSWHRREPRSASDTPAIRPMTETDTTSGWIASAPRLVHNLLLQAPSGAGLGIEREPSGLDDLAVYLEYYRPAATADAATWSRRADYALAEDPATFSFGETDAALVRIVVRWHPRGAANPPAPQPPVRRSYELLVARTQ
jgi:prepilin-type N-terminal cleavage/methylation domain-containing protein